MDTSSFRPEELGIETHGQDQELQVGLSIKRGENQDSVVRPIRRAWKGFISLIGGDMGTDSSIAPQNYFEKIRQSEQDQVRSGGFNRFQRALRRIRYISQFNPTRTAQSPLGSFGGRHIIGESTPINGGVYIGVVPQECLVVDDKHGALERVYNELVVRLAEISIDRKLDENEILPEIANLVLKHLKFDDQQTREITEREGIAADDKVAIDMYLYEHVGVARHQVLVAAYLIERLKKRGVLNGCFTLDPMSTHLMGHDDRLVYTSPHGYLFIFDPLKLNQ
ncbi:MAG: hypothetical protein K1X79_03440 [Oligoflexia bacterium]|nr:hypothetical protein [Oligoflexia bacterium]